MSGTKPAPLSSENVANAVEATKYVSEENIPNSLSKSALYYSLQDVPLLSFQRDMLVWDSDKLKVFAPGAKFLPPQVVLESPGVAGVSPLYKRTDDFTVLAVLPLLDSTVVVFTSEVAQTAWEIVGLFSLVDRDRVIADTAGLVSYDRIESGYSASKAEREENNDEEGDEESKEDSEYWGRYANDESVHQEVVRTERKLQKTSKDQDLEERDYWTRMSQQTPQITSGEAGDGQVVRQEIVTLLVNLVELYIDLGAPTKESIVDDIMSIAMGDGKRMKIGVPLVAHRHAIRTIRWLTKDGYDISAEAKEAILQVAKY